MNPDLTLERLAVSIAEAVEPNSLLDQASYATPADSTRMTAELPRVPNADVDHAPSDNLG